MVKHNPNLKYDFNNDIVMQVLNKWKYLFFMKYILNYHEYNPNNNINDAISAYSNYRCNIYHKYMELYRAYYRGYITVYNRMLKEKKNAK